MKKLAAPLLFFAVLGLLFVFAACSNGDIRIVRPSETEAPTPALSPTPTSAPKPTPTIKPTATPAPLSPARDLTGKWTGKGVYYLLNLGGNRVLKVSADVTLTLKQSGSQVSGILDVYPTRQEPTGNGNVVPEVEGHSSVNGTVSVATLTFYIGTKVAGTKEKWEFTFTTDLMSGHVVNLDEKTFLGRDSDRKAFSLTRR